MGTCSDSCGGGLLTKTRSKTVEEANGGVCDDQFSVTEVCNTDICPGTKILFSFVNSDEFYDTYYI